MSKIEYDKAATFETCDLIVTVSKYGLEADNCEDTISFISYETIQKAMKIAKELGYVKEGDTS